MPTCTAFLACVCTNSKCAYSHVKTNPSAPVCPDFVNGLCAQGPNCKLRHTLKRETKRRVNRTDAENNPTAAKRARSAAGADDDGGFISIHHGAAAANLPPELAQLLSGSPLPTCLLKTET
eukprot:gnl/Spiro4/23640_TR11689_c0_g1_i1.p3 gnl/Spiro4/23640_TR11689_c0_g1~~gnl/Spiro4/23640_TR11689_c0_g1_i1.p3  ORF type:complete len:121 (-),score=10.24 gnl/Spiro4/23640_TR11689_c0_g1_i1:45-407(-)